MSEPDKQKLTRKEMDKLEAEMIKRPFERREFAGDPNQNRRFWVRTRNKNAEKKGWGGALEGVRIRQATDADDAFFRELEMQTTWENLPPEDRRRLDREQVWLALDETHALLLARPGNVIFIAEVEGERAGLLWFGPNRNLVTGEEEGWIYNVTVGPAYRGRGIGRLLMQHAEAHAGEQGYAIIGLMVAVHNSIARELYHRLDYHDSNILMRKQLPAPAEKPPARDSVPGL